MFETLEIERRICVNVKNQYLIYTIDIISIFNIFII